MPADLKDNPDAAHSESKGRGHDALSTDPPAFANAMLQPFRTLPALVLLQPFQPNVG
jgi:hypothetical protein